MYLLGTFVVAAVPEGADQDDLDFFAFPELDQTIGTDALDAPIDGYMMASEARRTRTAAKELPRVVRQPEAADMLAIKAATRASSPRTPGRHGGYTALQKKSVELVERPSRIAQFLDRDTRPTSPRP